MINRNDYMVSEIKKLVKENQSDIDRLLGKTEVVVAERRNGNVSSSVFAKSSFSREEHFLKSNQKCNGRGCKSCKIMNLKMK